MKNKKTIICIILILLSFCYIAYNMLNAPKVMRSRPATIAQAANVYRVSVGSVPVYIETVATLIPFQSIILKSKVGGTIESLSQDFETGAIIDKGSTLLTVEKRDYENAVKKLEATLEKAKADYQVELGYQTIVQEELKQLEGIRADQAAAQQLHTDLTLRKPQLNQVLADLSIAEANLQDAIYDLEQTEIKSPFDAFILTRSVSVGQHISANETLAELVSVDKYLADVAIPIDTLYNNNLLSYKNKEVPIEIATNYGETWEGKLEQIVSALTTDSRMGKIIVSVDDPLALEKNSSKVPLLLGDQVNVRILAGTYSDVIKLPRSCVFNSTTIWVIDNENLLKQKKIDIIWADGDNVYIKSSELPNNSLVLYSGINNPVENLLIKPTIANLSDVEIEKIQAVEQEQEQQRAQVRRMQAEEAQRNSENMPQRRNPGEGAEGRQRPEGAAQRPNRAVGGE